MTNCGHGRVGDEGQRYEIRVQHKETGDEDVIGWSNKPDAFTEALSLWPKYRDTHVRLAIDRQAKVEDPYFTAPPVMQPWCDRCRCLMAVCDVCARRSEDD